MRSYVDARIATYGKLPDIAAAHKEVARSQQLQTEIWKQALAATRTSDNRGPTEMLLVTALNQMFDISAARIAATQIHPPTIIYLMLIGLALASALLAGYQSAAEVDPIHRFGFATIIALTIYVIFEIEYPRLGLVQIDAIDQLLIARWVQRYLEQYAGYEDAFQELDEPPVPRHFEVSFGPIKN